jgi:hypothetical protein
MSLPVLRHKWDTEPIAPVLLGLARLDDAPSLAINLVNFDQSSSTKRFILSVEDVVRESILPLIAGSALPCSPFKPRTSEALALEPTFSYWPRAIQDIDVSLRNHIPDRHS